MICSPRRQLAPSCVVQHQLLSETGFIEFSSPGLLKWPGTTAQVLSLPILDPLHCTPTVEMIGPVEQLRSRVAKVCEEALMLADNSHSFFRLNMRCRVIELIESAQQ